MVSDGCSDANGKVLVQSVGEHLLPTAQACRPRRPGLPVPAPGTRASHINLFGHFTPGPALVAQLEDLLGGCGMSAGTATHGDACLAKLLAHRGPGTPSSAPIWRRFRPWAYKSAARLTSTAPRQRNLSRIGLARDSLLGQVVGRSW
jgi:hypothetical protein